MKEIYIVFQTDIWISTNSFELLFISETMEEAIEKLKENSLPSKAYIQDVINQDNHLIISKCDMLEYDNLNIVFSTENDSDKKELNIKIV